MSENTIDDAALRLCFLADLGDDAVAADLERIEELLLTLQDWATDAASDGGDSWEPPEVLTDATIAAVDRIYQALRPTQTRREPGVEHDVEPDGPIWVAADGRNQLAVLSFVPIAAADIALVGEAAAELGRPDGDRSVKDAIDQIEDLRRPTVDQRERERRGVVVTAARIHGMLDLADTADTALLHQARRAVGEDAEEIVLTAEQEAAYHRTVDRITMIATLSDPLTRWAMGTRPRPHG